MRPRISMIALGVKNLEKSIEFYSKGLGFPKIDSPPEVAFFNLNGTWLALSTKKDLAKDANVSEEGSGFNGFSMAHNVYSEDEVNLEIDKAVEAGAIITKPARKTSWGGYSGYFKDLDGYLWEVAYNPFLWIGPKD